MLRTSLNTSRRRRGNILIVTLLLLALFATIGLTIVYYTKDLAEQQRINIEAQSNGALAFSDDGSIAFNQFLSDLIYDSPTPTPGSSPSFIWGHSLMRTMYGGAGGGQYPTVATVPWNGVGTFHESVVGGLDRAMVLNCGMAYMMGSPIMPEISNSGAFVPKNAPYTYPDFKDFYLASWAPATGEVLMPSFYRSNAFRGSGQATGSTGLEPGNPNWTNSAGMYLTVRPRPFDNGGASSTFPYPPPNADGTYTGDVQNILGSYYYNSTTGQFVAHNDAIWTDIGMAPITLRNGKTIKPLVAATIVDLDGVLNYNIHGNVYSSATGGSGIGLGPWEVNLVRALPTDGLSLINGRPTGTQSGISTRAYNKYLTQIASTNQMPTYAALPWNTGSGAAPGYLSLPGQAGSSFYSTSPSYSPTASAPLMSGYDSTNTPVNSPAMLYNPSEWPSNYPTSTTAAYPVSDLQSLISQYCATPYSYTSTSANPPGLLNLNGITPATSIRGTPSNYGFMYPPQPASTSLSPGGPTSNYRLDPASNNRCILTPYSWSLDMPGLAPNFNNLSATNCLALTPDVTGLTAGVLTGPAATSFPSPNSATGSLSDFAAGQWKNNRAGLGPIDLNRPLADYRGNTSQPLGPTNMIGMTPYNVAPYTTAPYMGTLGSQTVPQAVIDRQQFAMSIFVRLVVASGAYASYTVIPGVGESISYPGGAPTAGTTQFNALLSLAQLAANIVDYIDSDDVSTAFVWNPANTSDPLNPVNFQTANISNSVVFGVEKPRLVLNEAFSEITNNPNDQALLNGTPGNKNLQQAGQTNGNPYVRFWLELTNPSSTPYTGTGAASSPLGSGAATVRYTPTNSGVTTSYSPYLIQIARSPTAAGGAGGAVGLALRASPNNVSNVTGAIVGATPDIIFDFSSSDATPAAYSVYPASGNANGSGVPGQPSFLLCTPAATTPPANSQAPDWNPVFPQAAGYNLITTTTVLNAAAPTNGTAALAYSTLSLNTAINTNTGRLHHNSGLLENVILLRRLANPYMPPNDPTITVGPFAYTANSPANPYITVDYMDYVPATDQILMLNQQTTKRTAGSESATQYPNGAAQGGGASGLQSLGRVQPYCGWTSIPANGTFPSPTSGTYNFTFPTSLVVPQAVATPLSPQATQNGNTSPPINHTFGYVNSASISSTNYNSYPFGQTYIASSGGTAAMLKNGGISETIMTPFDWFPHMDRQLLNQSELLMVSTGKPYEYTLRTMVPGLNGQPSLTGNDVVKFGYMATGTINSTTSPNMLYRALDVLRIQPYGHMTALGGRVPGRINVNTIQDKRVWDSLFDSQAFNGFTQNDVFTMWNSMIGSRTPSITQSTFPNGPRYTVAGSQLTDAYGVPYVTPVPHHSVYDSTTGTGDRPFLPFGAPSFTSGGAAYAGGSGLLTDTLVRSGAILQPNAGTSTTYTYPAPHPYQQTEALRKIMNSTTTVSHTFAVWVTVGYFNYSQTGGSASILGSEYYNNVPGDLRRKYFAVVDRSMVGLDPSTQTLSTNLPFFTTVNGTGVAPAGSTLIPITTSVTGTGQVNAGPATGAPNGITTYIHNQTTGTNWIAIGTGATQEYVQATLNPKSPQNTTGATLMTVTPALKYPHWPGESVSNIIPGNPGPAASWPATVPPFYYSSTPHSYVVPFVVRLQ